MPVHLIPHLLRFGPAGIAGLLAYFAKAPTYCKPVLSVSAGQFSTHEKCFGLLGQTGWSDGDAIILGLIVFGVVALIMALATGKAFPQEG